MSGSGNVNGLTAPQGICNAPGTAKAMAELVMSGKEPSGKIKRLFL